MVIHPQNGSLAWKLAAFLQDLQGLKLINLNIGARIMPPSVLLSSIKKIVLDCM